MFKIGYDKKITMVQGDTGVIRMRISNYELSQGDEVRFAIVNKANPSILLCQHSDKKIVLEKQVTVFEKDGSARILIYPYDTEYLQPGKYLYEIQVKTKDGRIDTVVPLTALTLMDGSIQGEFGQTTPSKPELTPSEIELRFKRLENEIIPELGNRITNVENEIDSVSSSLESKIERIDIDISKYHNDNWDDTFKNCLELINKNGGGKLYIPNIEDINITKTIKIYSNTEIYSNGAIINFSGYSRLFENANRTTSEKDKNITLKGLVCVNKNRLTDNSKQQGVSFINIENIIIKNCEFIDFSGDGIYIGANGYSCKNATIANNTITNWGRMGIAVTDCDKCIIDGNKLTQLESWQHNSAIDIEPNTENDVINDIVIMNNTCIMGCINLYSKVSIPIQQNRIIIKNNKILNSDLVGINVSRFSNIDIVGNYLKNANEDGILCYLANNINVNSNIIENCLGENGIKISTSTIANIEGNIISGIKKFSIHVLKVDKVIVKNNRIDNYNIGIQFNTNVKYSTILGNIITNAVLTGALAILIYDNDIDGGCMYNNISNNIINDSNNSQSYGIRSANNSDYNIAVNNIINYASKSKVKLDGENNINNNNL